MPNIFKKARLAITSRYNYNKDLTDLQKIRLEVCRTCPHNSDNVKHVYFIHKVYLRLNKLLNNIFGLSATENSICTLCGCNLIFKSSQEDKSDWCEVGKWDNI